MKQKNIKMPLFKSHDIFSDDEKLLDIVEKLNQESTSENHEETATKWLEFIENLESELIPVYITGGRLMLYSIFIPTKEFHKRTKNSEILNNWGISVAESSLNFTVWGNGRIEINGPFENSSVNFYKNGEPAIYYRSVLRDDTEKPSPIEFNQYLIHASKAFWVNQYNAYCTLDSEGDYKILFKVIQKGDIKIALANKEKMNLFSFCTKQMHLRLFLFNTKRRDYSFMEPELRRDIKLKKNPSLSYSELNIFSEDNLLNIIQVRGTQIIDSPFNNKSAKKYLLSEDAKASKKEYASFIAHDWKNNIVKEISCSADLLSNYFQKSNLPYETTPAFFKPEVLVKYKNDPSKYDITNGQIICKGTWHLAAYDINDQGQVHTYLCYLQNLPYKEQLYWKSFNEYPKGEISKRSFSTDFLGEFWDKEDPMQTIKNILKSRLYLKCGSEKLPLIKPNVNDYEQQLDNCHLVLTDGKEEFRTEMIKISQVTVEALCKDTLIKWANILNCYDSKLGSLKLLEKCLQNSQIDKDVVQEIVAPLFQLWNDRSKAGIAHLGNFPTSENTRLKFRVYVEELAKSLAILNEVIKSI